MTCQASRNAVQDCGRPATRYCKLCDLYLCDQCARKHPEGFVKLLAEAGA